MLIHLLLISYDCSVAAALLLSQSHVNICIRDSLPSLVYAERWTIVVK